VLAALGAEKKAKYLARRLPDRRQKSLIEIPECQTSGIHPKALISLNKLGRGFRKYPPGTPQKSDASGTGAIGIAIPTLQTLADGAGLTAACASFRRFAFLRFIAR
jgi:hypothetical protein